MLEVDLFSDEVLEDPYPYYAAVRDSAPATYLPDHEVWAVGRYDDIRRALIDWPTFNSGDGVFLLPERNRMAAGMSVITTDPPTHDEMRQVYQQYISLRPLRAVVPAIDERADELVASLVARGSFDAVGDLARAFSVGLVCDLVGFPAEGRELLLSYSNAVFDTQGPLNDRHRAGLERYPDLFAYVAGLLEPGRLSPGGWGAAMLEGAHAGLYPLPWARAGVSSFIAAGERVLLLYGAANRDPRAFRDPETFDIQRAGRGHLGFGFGVHGCVGQALAKAEGAAVLGALARHVASFDVIEAERHLNNTLRGFARLEVTVTG